MPRKPGLRVVDPATEQTSEQPKPPATVAAAFDSGSRRQLLVAMATRLARALDDPSTPTKDISPLSRRLQEVTKELEALAAAAEQEDGTAAPTPDEHWTAI